MATPAYDSFRCPFLVNVLDGAVSKLDPGALTIDLCASEPFREPDKLCQDAGIVSTQESVIHLGCRHSRGPVTRLEECWVARNGQAVIPAPRRGMPAGASHWDY